MNQYNMKLSTCLSPKLINFKKALLESKLPITKGDYGPFIPYIFDEYKLSKQKVLFVGQQTNGGPGLPDFAKSNVSFDDLQSDWAEFRHNDRESLSHYNSPFWNFIGRVCEDLKIHKLGYAWSNISKFESNNSFPSGEIYELAKIHFNSMPVEIEILQPDIVVFLTGPNYDSVIRGAFPNVSFHDYPNLPIRQFCEVRGIPGKKSFRLHHPRYLRTYSQNLVILTREMKNHSAIYG